MEISRFASTTYMIQLCKKDTPYKPHERIIHTFIIYFKKEMTWTIWAFWSKDRSDKIDKRKDQCQKHKCDVFNNAALILLWDLGILSKSWNCEVGIKVGVPTLCVQSVFGLPYSLFNNLIGMSTGCVVGPTNERTYLINEYPPWLNTLHPDVEALDV